MAYWRLIMKGALGTVETWSTGAAYGVFGLSPDVPDQASADGILARLLTFSTAANVPASMRALLSTAGTFTGWRVELRAEDETILSIAEGNMASAVTGSGTASKTPQDAMVFSLRSTTPGARGRGRMYWPALGATLTPAFALSAPVPATLCADVKTWLSAIGGEMNAWYVSIGAAKSVVLSVRSVTDHVNRDIVQIQVGSALDTQRRRRDALLETYVSVTYP